MRTVVRIPGVFAEGTGKEVFEDLVRIFPEGRNNKSVGCVRPADDDRVRAFMDRLARAGFHPWKDPFQPRRPNEYALYVDRYFEQEDYESASYFVPLPSVYFDGLTKDWPGPLRLERFPILEGEHIGS